MLSKFNCAPKFDQNVKIPSREQVFQVCTPLSKIIIDQVYTEKEFVKVLGNFIATKFSVNVAHSSAPGVDPGDINLAAYYDFIEDEFCKTAIELVLITNNGDKFIILDQEKYERFIKCLADSLAHELVHMRQARARDFISPGYDNVSEDGDEHEHEMNYLSNPDEIDAYAHNIAVELKDNRDPFQKLNNPTSISIEESLNLWVYVNTFGQDINNPVMKRLLKKIYKRLT